MKGGWFTLLFILLLLISPTKGPVRHSYVAQHEKDRFVVGGEVIPEAFTVVVMAESENWSRSSVVHTVERKSFEVEWWVPRGEGSGTRVDVIITAFDAENQLIEPSKHETFFLRGEE